MKFDEISDEHYDYHQRNKSIKIQIEVTQNQRLHNMDDVTFSVSYTTLSHKDHKINRGNCEILLLAHEKLRKQNKQQ